MSPQPGSGGPPSRRRWHDIGVRSVSGLALIVVAIASTQAGGLAFTLVWLVAAIIVQWEWQRIVDSPGAGARIVVGTVGTVIAAAVPTKLADTLLVLVCCAIVSALLARPGRRLWAAAGIVYGGAFLAALLLLRASFPFGMRSIFWLFATVWSVDVFAYLGGRLIGGPKLWPRISPSKTWSGTLCGVVAGGAFGTFVALRDTSVPTALAPVLVLSLATAIVSQVGDGFESAMKRRFSVKDSSRIIPGHGGVLDRLDGFMAATLFAFLFGLARNMPPAVGLFYWA